MLGLVLEITYTLAPIHEIGHLIFGGGGRITGWDTATINKSTDLAYLGGYLFTLLLYGGIAMLKGSGFFYGAMLGVYFHATQGLDFLSLPSDAPGYWWTLGGIFALLVTIRVLYKLNPGSRSSSRVI